MNIYVSTEMLIWFGLLTLVNIFLLFVCLKFIVDAYRYIFMDFGGSQMGLTNEQKQTECLRWSIVFIIVSRLVFVIVCGISDGERSFDEPIMFGQTKVSFIIFDILYWIIEEINSEGSIKLYICIYVSILHLNM